MVRKKAISRDDVLAAYNQVYVKEGKGLKEVGVRLGCSKSEATRQLKQHGCRTRSPKEAAAGRLKLTEKDYIDAYEKWYISENLSLTQVSEKIGVSSSVLYGHFDELNLPMRNQCESMVARNQRRRSNIVKLHEEYISGRSSIVSLAKKSNVHSSTLNRQFKQLGLEIKRRPGELLTISDEQKIVEEYIQGGSTRSVGENWGISPKKVEKLIHKHGDQLRTISEGIQTALEAGRYAGRHARARSGNGDFFKNWTPESAWVFGLLLSDGSLLKNEKQYFCSLVSKDLEALLKVVWVMELDELAIYGPKKAPVGSNIEPVYVLTMSNKSILLDLERLGMHSRKSATVEIPSMPNQYIRHFMRGYIDGDGGFGMTKPRFSVKSKSQSMMMTFAEYLYRFAGVGIARKRSSKTAINPSWDDKFVSVYRQKMKTGIIFSIEVGGISQLRRLYDFLYLDVNDNILMSRKRNVIKGYFTKDSE